MAVGASSPDSRPLELDVLNEHERAPVVAYHEMGHALVAMGLPATDPLVHEISIIPRGVGASALHSSAAPTEDRFR